MATNPKGYANPHLLIAPAELAAALRESDAPLVLDLRPAEAFAAGHVPAAVHLDLFGISLIDTDPAPLRAFLWILEHLLATRGVSATRPVVVYDEQSGTRAARAFWALEYFGHQHTRLLDGGFAAWQSAGHPASTEAVAPVATSWTGTPVAERVASYRDVLDRLEAPDAVILDTRTDGEYLGTTVRAARGGCIPGAVHVEWTTNLRPDGSFKSADELRALYEPAGGDARQGRGDLLPGRLPRRTRLSRVAPVGLPARAQLCRFVEGVGRSARVAAPGAEPLTTPTARSGNAPYRS